MEAYQKVIGLCETRSGWWEVWDLIKAGRKEAHEQVKAEEYRKIRCAMAL